MTGFLDILGRLFGGAGPVPDTTLDLRFDGSTLSLDAPSGDGALPGRWVGTLPQGWRMPPSDGTYPVEYDPRSPRDIAMRIPGDPPRRFIKDGEGSPGSFDLVLPAEAYRILRSQADHASRRRSRLLIRVAVAEARPEPTSRTDDDLPPATQVDPYLPSHSDNQAAAQLAGLGYLRAMEDRNPEPSPPPAPALRDDGPVTAGGVGSAPFETRGGDKAGGDFVTGGGDGSSRGGDFVTGGGDGRDAVPASTAHGAPASAGDSWSPGSGGYGR